MLTGNITNVLNLSLYTYFVAEKYNRAINRRLSSIKINYIRINFYRENWIRNESSRSTFPYKDEFLYFLWMMVEIKLLHLILFGYMTF